LCAPAAGLGLISYGRLAHFVNSIGRTAVALGLAPHEVVAVHLRDPIFHSAVVLGLANLGIPTLSVREPAFPSGLRVDAIITDDNRLTRVGTTKVIRADLNWATDNGPPIEPDTYIAAMAMHFAGFH